MDYLALNDAIKKGELGNLYLFQGEENFTKERSLRRIMELWKDQLPGDQPIGIPGYRWGKTSW